MGGRIALCLILTSLAGAAVAATPPAEPRPDSLGADWGPQQNEARAAVRQGRFLPLARVIAVIRARTPGRELDSGIEQLGGRAVYRVRWAAASGRRIDYIVDAENGAILSAN